MIKNHLLSYAQYTHSVNHDARPDNCAINLLVLHNISLPPGQFNDHYVCDLFCNRLTITDHPYFKNLENLKVSSHLYISRQGDITQFVPFDKRAWHAGESEFNNQKQCNDFSIGIELAGTDIIAYNKAQYKTLAQIINTLKKNYPIKNIVGHCDIAPARKTDPGNHFDWQTLANLIGKDWQLKNGRPSNNTP